MMTSQCCTIEAVWRNIEIFLDIQSTIHTSQTCRSLQKIIVDEDTQKVRVSHFSVSEFDYGDTPVRKIPHYLSSALNAVHFPSLNKLDLGFPMSKCRRGEEGDLLNDACTACFPVFVAHIGSARNLESLFLSICPILSSENVGYIESLFEMFGRNLIKCRKLNQLSIYLCGREFSLMLLLHFMRALTPSIQKRRCLLQSFRFDIGCMHTDDLGSPNSYSDEEIDLMLRDFFVAVLSCENLKHLNIHTPGSFPLAKALLDSAAQLDSSSFRLSHVRTLDLMLTPTEQDHDLPSPKPLLKLFSRCNALKSFFLYQPQMFWEDNLLDVKNLLKNKRSLKSIILFCDCYDDGDGKMTKLIEDLTVKNRHGHGTLNRLDVSILLNVNGERWFKLIQFLERIGFTLYDNDARSVDTGLDIDENMTGVEGNIDIDYFRMMNMDRMKRQHKFSSV